MHTVFVKVVDESIAASPITIPGGNSSTPIVAGLLTGLLYKSGSGPRGAILAASFGVVASSVYWYGGAYCYSKFTRNSKW